MKPMKKNQSSGGVTEVRSVDHPTIKAETTADGHGGKPRSRDQEADQNQAAAGLSPLPPVRNDIPEQTPVQGAAAGPTGDHSPDPAPQGNAARLKVVAVVLGEQLDEGLVKEVEILTRGQWRNEEWFIWRKYRVTATLASLIVRSHFVNGRSKTLPASYLTKLKGEASRCQTMAMKWGIEMEEEAVRQYQVLKSHLLGRKVTVRGCGLFIIAQRPWLAASPDGIVTDGVNGEWLLEVKCPYKHRDKLVRDACREDKNFCLWEKPDGSCSLKTSHKYFTQIQVQLAVTGLKHADLVVFTQEDTVIVPVTFDPELWKDTLSKLEMFYTEAYPSLYPGSQAAAVVREL